MQVLMTSAVSGHFTVSWRPLGIPSDVISVVATPTALRIFLQLPIVDIIRDVV